MITFSADEVFEMAEQIERNGAKFYRAAADSASSDNRELFIRLAEMEDGHEKIFATMRKQLGNVKRSFTADPDNEAALYLQAMSSGKVFDMDLSATIGGTEAIEDILTIAIGLEKDSIVFYHSMKEVVPDSGGKEKISAIISEEIRHIVDLRNQLRGLR